jgi:hypothetical protein
MVWRWGGGCNSSPLHIIQLAYVSYFTKTSIYVTLLGFVRTWSPYRCGNPAYSGVESGKCLASCLADGTNNI